MPFALRRCTLANMTFLGTYATDLGSAHAGTFVCPEQPKAIGRTSSEPNPTWRRKAPISR